MNGPCPNEDAVAGIRVKAGQMVCDCSVGIACRRTSCRGARFQASVDASFGPFFQDNPCFGFSRIARRNQFLVRIGRMHLNGEPLAYIEKLQQQGEAGVVPASFPSIFPAMLQQMPMVRTFEHGPRRQRWDGHRGR
jgi:hypothetical protein